MTQNFQLARLLKEGGQIQGPLLLDGAPAVPTEAADKAYVDSRPTGIADAPTDGQLYGRKSAAWSVTPAGGIADAPNDATLYGRKSLGWAHLTHADITDWAATLSAYLLLTGGTLTGLLTLPRSAFPVVSVTANGATTINAASGEVQNVSLTGNATIAVSNWPTSGTWAKVVLKITNAGAFAITAWPSGAIWPGGSAPTITSGAGKRDCVILMSDDAGATVWGSIAGQNYS